LGNSVAYPLASGHYHSGRPSAMPLAERLEITQVHSDTAGDVTFPPIDPEVWRQAAREEHAAGPGDEASFAFVTYRRRQARAAERSG